jgi:para-nitrobenzyl esterase
MDHVVEVTGGKVEGFEMDGIAVFLGIPFAAPPTGERRWLPPEPVQPWTGIRETKALSPIAPQIVAPPDSGSPLRTGFQPDTRLGVQPSPSEDCLYLNVWTPAPDRGKRPVMFWIHGGGFTGGSGSSPVYNGGVLAGRGDVVVVTINYRLNVFGFLRLADVTGGRIPSTGSEGMLDQLAALQWVRENIGAFGGDPGNVTIFGESAGGGSVGALLGMPAAKGLYHKAIAQSGSASFLSTRDDGSRYAERFLEAASIEGSDAGALRALTMEQVLRAYVKSLPVPRGVRSPMPVIDDEAFPEMPIDAMEKGSADGIPLMAGTMADEWRLWMAMDQAIVDMPEGRMFGRFSRMMPRWDLTDTVAAYRRLLAERSVPTTAQEIYLAIMTARMFWVPTVRMLEVQEQRGNPAYAYRITWRSPLEGGRYGACHGMDVGLLWGAHRTDFFGKGPAADALSAGIQDAWLAFARTGDPSCEGLGEWPAYGESRNTMILGEKSGVQEAPLEEERRIWDDAPADAYKWG